MPRTADKEPMIEIWNDAVYEKRGERKCLVSGHEILIGRTDRQIHVKINGNDTYHNDYERAAWEIKRAKSAMDTKHCNLLESLVAAEIHGWHVTQEIIKAALKVDTRG